MFIDMLNKESNNGSENWQFITSWPDSTWANASQINSYPVHAGSPTDSHHYDPHSLRPIEYALSLAHEVIYDLQYVSLTDAARNDSISSSEQVELFDLIIADGSVSGDEIATSIYERMERRKEHADREPLRKKALWLLETIERTEGHSVFTDKAREVLEFQVCNWRVITRLIHLMNKLDQDHQMRLPKRPLKYSSDKMSDIPGVWQIRRIKSYVSYYGEKVYLVCSDENENGISFSMSKHAFMYAKVKLGHHIFVRGNVDGVDEQGKYLKLERVKIERNIDGKINRDKSEPKKSARKSRKKPVIEK